MKTLAALAGCMFGFAGVCHAGQIASPAIYAAYSQKVALCVIHNGGTTAQTVQARLFDEAGTALTGVNNVSCAAPLLPGGFCLLSKIGVSNDEAYACAATAGSTVHLRGSMILQDGSGTSLRSAPLR